jgi:hypothetical protein
VNTDTNTDFDVRCTELVSAAFQAHRRVCNAALAELAATIHEQAGTLYRQCLALGVCWSDRTPGLALLESTPQSDAAFRREAEEWAEELRVFGDNTMRPDPQTYICGRRGNAEKAWAAVAADVAALIAENAERLGRAPLPPIGGSGIDGECAECADPGACPSCDGSGENAEDGQPCEPCSGSGQCPDCEAGR